MKISDLIELLSKLNPEADVKIAGLIQADYGRDTWKTEILQEHHFRFERNLEGKLTVYLELEP